MSHPRPHGHIIEFGIRRSQFHLSEHVFLLLSKIFFVFVKREDHLNIKDEQGNLAKQKTHYIFIMEVIS